MSGWAGGKNAAGIQTVVDGGLCHRCGACVGFCPVGTFDVDDTGRPVVARSCIQCNVCMRVCSGAAVDYPALGRAVFGPDYAFGDPMETVRSAYIGAAAEDAVRRRGASGGVITQLLLHWLETGRIRGAVLIVEDARDPSRGMGIVARTRADILRGPQSRYTTSPVMAAFREIQREPGPFALVGLPCQIHALRMRQQLDPAWLARVPIAVGILCHYNLPCEASRLAASLVTPNGRRVVHAEYRNRDARGWPHNTLQLTFDDGSCWRSPYGPAQIFNLISHAAPLGRCLYCLDATAEFADFAVGDPWIRDAHGRWKYEEPDGWSSILVRTAQGQALLEAARETGCLHLRPIPAREIFEGQATMIREKRERVPLRIRLRRRLGLPVPAYPMPLPRTSPRQALRELRFLSLRLVPMFPPLARGLVRLGLSPVGSWVIRGRMRRRARRATH